MSNMRAKKTEKIESVNQTQETILSKYHVKKDRGGQIIPSLGRIKYFFVHVHSGQIFIQKTFYIRMYVNNKYNVPTKQLHGPYKGPQRVLEGFKGRLWPVSQSLPKSYSGTQE